MQSVSSRFWTRVTASIFYDDNHYTTDTSIKKELCNYKQIKLLGWAIVEAI